MAGEERVTYNQGSSCTCLGLRNLSPLHGHQQTPQQPAQGLNVLHSFLWEQEWAEAVQICSCRWPQKRWPTRLARVHRGTQARCVLGEPVAGYRKRLEGRVATLEPQPLFLPGFTAGEPSVCLSLARCLPQPILQPVLFVRLPQPVLLPD